MRMVFEVISKVGLKRIPDPPDGRPIGGEDIGGANIIRPCFGKIHGDIVANLRDGGALVSYINVIIGKQRNGPVILRVPMKFKKCWGAFEAK